MEIQLQDAALYYEVYGEGRPLLFLHGNGESSDIFRDLPGLMQNHQVYLIDSRGHGKSSRTEQLSYMCMAEDIRELIQRLQIEKPILFGFSDGGIIGLLLAIQYPGLLSKLIAAGANLNPAGMKKRWRLLIALSWLFTRSRLDKMMLLEPDILLPELLSIQIPVLITAGSRDIILEKHTKMIAGQIPSAQCRILEHETHSSYIMDNHKLYSVIMDFICES